MSGINNLVSYTIKTEVLVKSEPEIKKSNIEEPVNNSTKSDSIKTDTLVVDTNQSKKEEEISKAMIEIFSYLSDSSAIPNVHHEDLSTPIPQTLVKDYGKDLDKLIYDEVSTPDKLLETLFTDKRLIDNNKLKNAVNSFIEKILDGDKKVEIRTKELVAKNKEVINDDVITTVNNSLKSYANNANKAMVIYSNELLNRNPKIKDNELIDIFYKLTTMLDTKFDSRVDSPKQLIMEALGDIALPSNITQEKIGTCSGTSVQIQMAIRNPKEYLNMLDKLAKNQSYKTLTGNLVKPNWTFTKEGFSQEDGKSVNNFNSERNLTAKIMQNAIMDFADGDSRNFDSSKADGGLDYEQISGALKSLLNKKVKNYDFTEFSPTQLMKVLEKSKPTHVNPIEIAISYDEKGKDAYHAVNVVDFSRDTDKITIINPWGREEMFPISELTKRIMAVIGKDKLNPVMKENTILYDKSNKDLLDNNMYGILDNLSTDDKLVFVSTITELSSDSPDKNKILDEDEKKVIISILNNVFNESALYISEYNYNSLASEVGKDNIPLLLTRLDNGSIEYLSVKNKLESLKKS